MLKYAKPDAVERVVAFHVGGDLLVLLAVWDPDALAQDRTEGSRAHWLDWSG
jgi:hypothetical protein